MAETSQNKTIFELSNEGRLRIRGGKYYSTLDTGDHDYIVELPHDEQLALDTLAKAGKLKRTFVPYQMSANIEIVG